MLLFTLILLPLVAALAVALLPARHAKSIALVGTLASVVVGLLALLRFQSDGIDAAGFQLAASIPWISDLGLTLSVGVDGVSLTLVLLTLLLGPICVLCSFTAITDRLRTYYAWLLVLQGAMVGVFAARDLILFYTCFEFTLVPMYVLISLYGSVNRKRAAIKFFLYTFTGSMIALAGLVYVAWFNSVLPTGTLGAGRWTFDIATLENAAASMTASQQGWVLLALMAGFAVKVPLFPLHTWLPLAHTEAPTAGSVILAGVLLKLGTYGIYRFALPFCPQAMVEYAPLIAVLCIIGILYGGLICWVQTDVKKLVAYSSVAHLGFCILGLLALNQTGITGAVLYMINHGLSTGALFLCIGMIYERYHTRSMKELGGLAARMPVWSTFMVFFVMASVGLPGLNGFISEFLCLLGAFQASDAWGSGLWNTVGGLAGGDADGATPGTLGPWYAAIAGIGMIIAAIYLLYMTGNIVWGPLKEPHGHGGGHGGGHGSGGSATGAHVLPTDLSGREIGILVPLAALCLFLGVYPKPLMQLISAPIAASVAAVDDGRAALARVRGVLPGPTPRIAAAAETPASSSNVHTETHR